MSDLLDRDAAMKLRDTLADIIGAAPMSSIHSALSEYRKAIRALPAVQVAVKPGEIERAVWSAMMWAADNNPGFNGVPEYTDRGNSFAEDEARRAAARIRSALTSDLASVRAAYVAESDAHEVTKAALAAQIEADAGIAEAQEALAAKRANDDDADARSDWDDGLIFGTQVGARLISATIRAQPHDRTALDRMLRAERDKALLEAADIAAHYTDKITAEDIANAILAMVEQEEPDAS